MKSIICWLFGHQPPIYGKRGWWSPGHEYATTVRTGTVDGIGREHAEVFADCPRCGANFKVCRIHLPKPNEGAPQFGPWAWKTHHGCKIPHDVKPWDMVTVEYYMGAKQRTDNAGNIEWGSEMPSLQIHRWKRHKV